MVYLWEWFVSLAIQLSDESSIFNAVHHISCLCPKFNCTFPSRSQQYSSDLVRHDLEVKFCFFVVIGLFLCYNRPPLKYIQLWRPRTSFMNILEITSCSWQGHEINLTWMIFYWGEDLTQNILEYKISKWETLVTGNPICGWPFILDKYFAWNKIRHL